MPHWKKDLKKKNCEIILSLVPEKPETIRSSELFGRATNAGLSTATIFKHLAELVKYGDLRRIQYSHAKVYYQRTESAKLQLELIRLSTLWANQIEEVYSHLNEEERQTLLKLLKNVSSKVGPIYEKYAKKARAG